MSVLSEFWRGPLRPLRAVLSGIADRTAEWELREWSLAGIGVQLLLLLFMQIFWWLSALWQPSEEPSPELQTQVDMSFVEFQKVTEDLPQQTQDLSEKIVEKEKLEKEQPPINWDNAVDPGMDFSQRYEARLSVNVSTNDYPPRATKANIGSVVALVDIYIGSDGKVKDVRIRQLRSAGNAHQPFENDFRKSVRRIILQKTKLLNKPYSVNGVPKDFVWQTRITFTL